MRSNSLHHRFQRVIASVAGVMAVLVAVVLFLSARSHYLENSEASARAIAAANETAAGQASDKLIDYVEECARATVADSA